MAGKRYQSDDARLCCVMDTARHVMKFYREERLRGVRLLAGDRYSANAAVKKRYINLISLYVNIVSRNLISQNPRVLLSTFDRAQKAACSAAETWMNQELVVQDFAGTMKRIVLDGLFSMGIAKCCLAAPADAALQGWGLDAGRPYLTRIDLDDFVCDYRARDLAEMQFSGHRYRAPLEMVRDDSRFNKKAREALAASEQISYNHSGDERIGEIGRDYQGYNEDVYDMVDLWEIYCPLEKCVKTFTEDNMSGPNSVWEGNRPIPLGVQKWIGPDRGPYVYLAYEIVPGNLFPKGPVQNLINLDEGANEAYRKLMRQSARLKINSVCDASDPSDGVSMNKANDGDTVPLRNPGGVKEIKQGGPDPGLFQWTREVISRFMEQAGNLATMGGLASQAGTLGQEELLAQQSNGQVAAMQDATAAFVTKCADSMLWYFWNDPTLVMKAKVNDPNLPDVDLVRTVHPWTQEDPSVMRRVGDKPDLKIDAYSMRHTTPQQRAKDLMSFLTQIYVPLAALFEQQGKRLSLTTFTKMFAKYIDSPDLESIFEDQAPSGPAGNSPPSAESGNRMPPNTSREYVRRSAGADGKASQDMEMDNAVSAMAGAAGMNGESY